MFNHVQVVVDLARRQSLDEFATPLTRASPPRDRSPPNPCLPARLPSTGEYCSSCDIEAPRALEAELKRQRKALEIALAKPSEDEQEQDAASTSSSPKTSPNVKRKSVLDILPSAIQAAKMLRETSRRTGSSPWKPPEPFEIMRAIERKDIMFLMDVRDRSFESLVKKSGDVTPLIHAMRIEATDIAIVLLGAFSRYINNLNDEDFEKPETKKMLKMLRVNLKIAIDYGLQKSQKDLIASFLQTLIMSEGDSWLTLQTGDIAAALRQGVDGKAVHAAEAAVRSFATNNLGKAHFIATLEDYIANATADLVMMAAWSNILQYVQDDPMPTYYFARDDRVYRAFVERLDRHQDTIRTKVGRRLRWQLGALRVHLEGRSKNYRTKVESLAKELDESEGH
ncbi:uncharacterized protein BXZ73DRAFT_40794 [Epithele typhae]|uniref:uncharacterized protein n=1 Tax=Epithele typhae TaxID=378194 RepID=UPI00200784DB|nr:uncharacterized protein BXZ73DRAFT_40794 [Epithele typhae]KAH9943039.1 hypothetical protein BXZ73DRAFT_40794 [Epithele typhae]